MSRSRRPVSPNDDHRTNRSAEREAADSDYVLAVALVRNAPRNDIRALEIAKFAREQRENARRGKVHFVSLGEIAERLPERGHCLVCQSVASSCVPCLPFLAASERAIKERRSERAARPCQRG